MKRSHERYVDDAPLFRDAAAVLEWIIWDVRVRDVPGPIRDAIERLAPQFPRRDREKPRSERYSEGRYRLSVFPDNVSPLIESRPLDVAAAVDDALVSEPLYLLVCDVGQAVAKGWEGPNDAGV